MSIIGFDAPNVNGQYEDFTSSFLSRDFTNQESNQASNPVIPRFSGPPRPLDTVLRPVPGFRPEMLPPAFRAWASDITERMQCAAEFVAVPILVAASIVVGRKVAIRPKQQDSWTVVPNLWGMIVGRPGVLKTPAAEEAMRPLRRLMAESAERHEAEMAEHRREALIHEAQRDAAKDGLKKAAKKSHTDAQLREYAEAALREFDRKPPVARRYLTSDATVEKLGEILSENPNGIGIYRDELLGLLRNLDKQGHETDRTFYLEGWNGSNPFTYDRIGRGTVTIPAVCLSVLGSIQPGPLGSYLRSAVAGQGDDGLISRFQLAVYPDQDREFRIVDREPDTGAKNRAFRVFKALDSLEPLGVGAEYDQDRDTLPYLRFSQDAYQFFTGWWADLEAKLRGDEHPAIESHLSKYRSLMPSLALIFHLIDSVDMDDNQLVRLHPVSLDAARMAAAWCDFLEEHARRIYEFSTDADMQPARSLAKKLADALPDPFTARDVTRKGWSGLTGAEDVERALVVLEDHDYIRPAEHGPESKGGRPTTRYHVNPALRGEVSSVLSVAR